MTLVSTPSNPVPDGAVSGFLKTRDGRSIRFARFAPPAGRKGTLCVFQGRSEFMEKYFEVAQDARARGFAVAMIDWRGQGLSDRALRDPRKGHVGSFAEYDIDIETFMKEVVLPDCPPPVFALGHSMGGAVLLRIAHQGRRWFDRIVLSAPLIGLERHSAFGAGRLAARTLRMLGLGRAYIPGGGATAVPSLPYVGNPLTSDPVRYARTAAIVDAEPKLGLGAPTIGWVDAMFKVMRQFADPSYPARIRQPILIVAAGQDAVVSTPAISQYAVRLRVGSHLVIAGARHELLMEQDLYRSQFWAAFDAFVPGSRLFG
jgi:lysophospholipase